MGTLCYRKRHHAINSNYRKRERHGSKRSVHQSQEAVADQSLVHDLLHSSYIRKRDVRQHGVHGRSNALSHRQWIISRAHSKRHAWPWTLIERNIDFGEVIAAQIATAHIVKDADNFPFQRWPDLRRARN